MVMEYLEGATLMQAVTVHKFSEPQVAYIARYVLKAILFLHGNAIAHRDLKSSNIMLTCSGSVKVIDLGLCTDVSQGQITHMVGSVRNTCYGARFESLGFDTHGPIRPQRFFWRRSETRKKKNTGERAFALATSGLFPSTHICAVVAPTFSSS